MASFRGAYPLLGVAGHGIGLSLLLHSGPTYPWVTPYVHCVLGCNVAVLCSLQLNPDDMSKLALSLFLEVPSDCRASWDTVIYTQE